MLPIHYGKCSLIDYFNAGKTLVQDFDAGNMSAIADKINAAFFDGGVFALKSFSALASLEKPRHPCCMEQNDDRRSWSVTIGKQPSNAAFLGCVEAIPFIGSVLAVINALKHLYGMSTSYQAFQNATVHFRTVKGNDNDINRGACSHYTHFVFDAAVDYTVHRNHLIGSLLSIIPFVKPVIRLAQAALYQPPIYTN